jgi:hypothetical protein
VQKRGIFDFDGITAAAETAAQGVEEQVAAAVTQASGLFDEIKSKASEVINSALATLQAKAQEVKDKIQDFVTAAQQIGQNIGPCVRGQSEAAEDVLKLAGTASRRFYCEHSNGSIGYIKREGILWPDETLSFPDDEFFFMEPACFIYLFTHLFMYTYVVIYVCLCMYWGLQWPYSQCNHNIHY